jgi:hypothetical protein
MHGAKGKAAAEGMRQSIEAIADLGHRTAAGASARLWAFPGGDPSVATKKAVELLKDGDVESFNQWVKERREKGKSSVDLDDKNLSGLKLRDADLRHAHLNGANLRDADLTGADLHGARLRQADLRGTDLTGADLSDADLRKAKLKGATLKKAKLKGARGLD